MVYEIFTYGGGEMLRDLFNGIAATVGDNSYQTLINIFVLFAILWVLTTTAFGGRFTDIPRWGIIFFLTLGIMYIPKSSVLITDQVKGGMQYAVDNVPFGLAFFASLTSQIGNTLTEKMEANFSMPDDLKYHQAGTLMAGSIVRTSNQFRITDANMAANIRGFVQQCVQYDILLGKYTLEEVLTTHNIWSFITQNPSPARAFLYQNEITTCANGAQSLQNDWNQEINDRALTLYGKRLFGDYLDEGTAKNELIHYLPISYSYLLSLSDSAQNLMQQNMMIGAFEEGILGHAAQVNAPAAVQNYAQTRAMQQQRSAYQLTGEMAEHWLPIMQNVFEAVLYGTFIIIFPLCLLPMGIAILKNYIFCLFWLQTWPPLYAVLNMVMTWFSQNNTLQAAATHNGYALNISTLPGIEQVNVDMSVVAAYLSMSIPFLSFYLIKGLAAGFGQMANHLGNLTQSAILHGAEEATSGNYSIGNTNYRNWNAYNTSSHHFNDNLSYQSGLASIQTETGAMIHHTPDNTRVIETHHAVSNIPTSINFADSLRATYSKMSEASTQAAVQSGSQLAVTQTQMHRDLYDLSNKYGESEYKDNSFSLSENQSIQQALSEYQSTVDTFAQREGLSTSQATSVLANAGVGVGTPKFFGVEASARADIQGVNEARKQEVFDAAQDYIEQTNFNQVTENAFRASQDMQHRTSHDVGQQLSENISHSYDESTNLRTDMTSHLQRAESYRESASLTSEQSSSINTIANQQFVNYLEKDQGSTTAAEQLLTRNPIEAHAKAEEFVKQHYAEILAETSSQHGLKNESSIQKTHHALENNIHEVAKDRIKPESFPIKEALHDKTEAFKTQNNFTDSTQETKQTIEKEIDHKKSIIDKTGTERKTEVLKESDQSNDTLSRAASGALESIASIAPAIKDTVSTLLPSNKTGDEQ